MYFQADSRCRYLFHSNGDWKKTAALTPHSGNDRRSGFPFCGRQATNWRIATLHSSCSRHCRAQALSTPRPRGKARTGTGKDHLADAVPLAESIVLFEREAHSCNIADFDLVVLVLTPPAEWLEELAAKIAQSHALMARSRMLLDNHDALRSRTCSLRREVAFLREQSANQRLRSRQLTNREHEPDRDR
jgi:hypothetical protein